MGSPQIRNRGTVGANLGSASPAGDAHPPLLASQALVVNGRVVFRDGRLLTGDEFQITSDIAAESTRLRARAGL